MDLWPFEICCVFVKDGLTCHGRCQCWLWESLLTLLRPLECSESTGEYNHTSFTSRHRQSQPFWKTNHKLWHLMFTFCGQSGSVRSSCLLVLPQGGVGERRDHPPHRIPGGSLPSSLPAAEHPGRITPTQCAVTLLTFRPPMSWSVVAKFLTEECGSFLLMTVWALPLIPSGIKQ